MGDAHWMEKAFANAGKPGHSLRTSLKVKQGKALPAAKVAKAAKSDNTHLARMANLAKTAAKVRRGKR